LPGQDTINDNRSTNGTTVGDWLMTAAAGHVEEILSYHRYVKKIACAADGKIILNRSPEHAAVIVEHLFLCSENEVDILTSELNETVYGSDAVIRAAIAFMKDRQNSRIRILVEKKISSAHPFLKRLLNTGLSNHFEINQVPAELQETYRYNFSVGDGHHFRFEKDRRFFDAVVQFGAPSVGAKLHSVFLELRRKSELNGQK
jgi:hypothetical protein